MGPDGVEWDRNTVFYGLLGIVLSISRLLKMVSIAWRLTAWGGGVLHLGTS